MRTALKIDKIVFTTTVSVKIVGTLLCLLVPSMLVYKVWWLNRDKQLWESQGLGEHEKEKTAFCLSFPTIFVWDCVGKEFEGVLTDRKVNL